MQIKVNVQKDNHPKMKKGFTGFKKKEKPSASPMEEVDSEEVESVNEVEGKPIEEPNRKRKRKRINEPKVEEKVATPAPVVQTIVDDSLNLKFCIGYITILIVGLISGYICSPLLKSLISAIGGV